MNTHIVALALFLTLISSHAFAAKEFPVQGRIFASSTKIDPEDLNQEMEAQGLDKFDFLPSLGVEILFPMAKLFEAGLRYQRRNIEKDEVNNALATDYKGIITQDSVSAVLRIPVIKTAILRIDGFGAVGGNNTSFQIKTASQDGELTKKEGNDWFASVFYSYGASVAIGYKWLFLVVEGGVETNKVDGFKRVGNINGNVEELDLSGTYFSLGLLFDGVPGRRR